MPPESGRRTHRLTFCVPALLLEAALFLLVLVVLIRTYVPGVRTPYAFDVETGAPGVSPVFDTAIAAAHDFGTRYNPLSIKARKEFSSVLYVSYRLVFRFDWEGLFPRIVVRLAPGGYRYTLPVAGSSDSAIPDLFGARGHIVGIIHSHGAYDPIQGTGNDDFSFGRFHDTYWAELFSLPFYLATPDGRLRVYLPDLIGPSVITLSDDLPYDPLHPSRIIYSSGGGI